MSQHISRREFNKLLATVVAGSTLGIFEAPGTAFASRKSVVIIGGGFGGASAAKYIRKLDPSISVTLVEPREKYYTCPFSNMVLAGMKTMPELVQTYDVLKNKYGVDVIADSAIAIDAVKRSVKLKSGRVLGYDRLIVSPGIDFNYGAIEGYSEALSTTSMPHAWQAGPQTELLRKQLFEMKDGGTVLISVPANPYRCPPGPYERASLIAWYLKEKKPKSKIIILDAKDKFSKQALFRQGWERRYPELIEWRSAATGGKIMRIDGPSKSVFTEFGQEKGAVINIIPPQQAGRIASESGLADATGWCPINPVSFESTIHQGIHVIGDACIAGAMPKSGFAASSQGKVAAASIIRLFQGKAPAPPSLVNTCYSFIGPGYAVSVAGVYKLSVEGIVEIPGSGGLTPLTADEGQLGEEATFASGWYNNITSDIWG